MGMGERQLGLLSSACMDEEVGKKRKEKKEVKSQPSTPTNARLARAVEVPTAVTQGFTAELCLLVSEQHVLRWTVIFTSHYPRHTHSLAEGDDFWRFLYPLIRVARDQLA